MAHVVDRLKSGRLSGSGNDPETVTVRAGDYTITISGEALDALRAVAEQENATLADVLARAISLQKTLAEARRHGDRVFIQRRDNRRDLVLA